MLVRKLQKIKMNNNKFKPDILLADGQDLREYGFGAKIIHLPGHTKGSTRILASEGVLFAGDTLANRKKPGSAEIIGNSQELENSLARIKNLNIRTVYPGHGKPFSMESYLQKHG